MGHKRHLKGQTRDPLTKAEKRWMHDRLHPEEREVVPLEDMPHDFYCRSRGGRIVVAEFKELETP